MGIWKIWAPGISGGCISSGAGLNEVLFHVAWSRGSVYMKAHYPLQQSVADYICGGIAQMLKDYYVQEVLPSPATAALLGISGGRPDGALPWRRLPPARGRT